MHLACMRQVRPAVSAIFLSAVSVELRSNEDLNLKMIRPRGLFERIRIPDSQRFMIYIEHWLIDVFMSSSGGPP